MQPLEQLDRKAVSGLRYILTDIDDTITREGKIHPRAYEALWRLKEAGLSVIPVTGRPAGWCDLIIRQWPVDAVVGENGAFVYHQEGKTIRTFTHPSVASPDIREKLNRVREVVLEAVPGSRVARDQFCRIYDLAIDFAEDPPDLGLEAAVKIRDVCLSLGAEAKISSIHVNTWFGSYDKLSMTRLFLKEIRGEESIKDRVFFFGDSPNDEPMFSFFPLSCAVANIGPFLDSLTHKPGYLAPEPCGEGFTLGVERILSLRAGI